jgi:hypothetical protein
MLTNQCDKVGGCPELIEALAEIDRLKHDVERLTASLTAEVNDHEPTVESQAMRWLRIIHSEKIIPGKLGLELKQFLERSPEDRQSEPEVGRCPTCSRWLEQRCPVCGPSENRQAQPAESLRAIVEEILAEGGADQMSHAYLGEAMLVRIRAALNRGAERG